MISAEFKKRARRAVRYNGIVERAQQIVRSAPTLSLNQIGFKLDIKHGDILIDCGANVGDVTSSFARTGAKVFAFEPNPLCFSILQKRFAMTPNVQCFNRGVMDRETTLTLATPKAHLKWDSLDTTVSASFNRRNNNLECETVDVQCISLSDFILSLNNAVRLVKMDIEGSEIEVINNLIDTKAIHKIDFMVVETHEQQQPELLEATDALRSRIAEHGLSSKIRLDWI